MANHAVGVMKRSQGFAWDYFVTLVLRQAQDRQDWQDRLDSSLLAMAEAGRWTLDVGH